MANQNDEGVESLRVDSLSARVYRQMKKMILTNRLWPGQQIVIDQLVKQFGVSHTPVREALGMLQADGLVTIERYKNPQVAPINATDVREVYEMRLLLEGWAMAEATRRLSDQDLAQLNDRLNQVREDISQGRFEGFLDADLSLHDTITGTLNHSLFSRIQQLISNQSTRIRTLVEATHSAEVMHVILDEHQAIVDALLRRDPEQARLCMEDHLRNAMQRTLTALQEIPRLEKAA